MDEAIEDSEKGIEKCENETDILRCFECGKLGGDFKFVTLQQYIKQ